MHAQVTVQERRQPEAGVALYAVDGDPHDDGWAEWLERELLSEAPSGDRIVIDLRRATRVDAAALGLFVRVLKRVRPAGGEVSIVYGDRETLRVFEITGLDRTFDLVEAPPRAAAG